MSRFCLAAFLVLQSCTSAFGALVFAEFDSVDSVNNTAMGTLNGVAFEVAATLVRSQTYTGEGVLSGVLDNTSSVFDSPSFTPPVAMTDTVNLGSTSDYSVLFTQPVSNLTVHLSELGPNLLDFNLPFTVVSDDGDLVASGTTVIGPLANVSVDDGNGSLFFAGPVSNLTWTSNAAEPADGFAVQFSTAVPEPSPVLLLGLLGVAVGCRSCWKRGIEA